MNESRICALIENATKEKTFAGNCEGFILPSGGAYAQEAQAPVQLSGLSGAYG